MRAIHKYKPCLDNFRRYVVAIQVGKKVNRVVVSATSEHDAIGTARLHHGGGAVQYARLATAADMGAK